MQSVQTWLGMWGRDEAKVCNVVCKGFRGKILKHVKEKWKKMDAKFETPLSEDSYNLMTYQWTSQHAACSISAPINWNYHKQYDIEMSHVCQFFKKWLQVLNSIMRDRLIDFSGATDARLAVELGAHCAHAGGRRCGGADLARAARVWSTDAVQIKNLFNCSNQIIINFNLVTQALLRR